jgi:methionyl-tRNA synthetase
LNWGVPVPVEGAEGKVLYVWFDAPIGYISATKEWAESNGKDWKEYWQDDATRLVHFIGKDNIVFHCIIFPTMLKAHGDYILPDNVPANEFLNLENNKISTSRNWAVWLNEFLEELPGKEDVLRYTLCANAPETKDNDFTWKDFQAKNNNELVAILGNFVNRVIVLTHKYFNGGVPERGELFNVDEQVINAIQAAPKNIASALDHYKFREALSQMMELARAGNRYLAETEPWKLIKSDPGRVKTILNLGLQVVANLGIVAEPFLPFTAKKINDILHQKRLTWNDASASDLLEAGRKIVKAQFLFEKIDDELIDQQVQKLLNTRKMNEQEKTEQTKVAPAKDILQFDDFMKMDMRVGKILEAEKVEKSNKLLKMQVDTGVDQRTIVSGIAKHFKPEEVVGKQVTVLINLAPRKIMGIESQGMILLAEDADGKLVFITPEQAVQNGSGIS